MAQTEEMKRLLMKGKIVGYENRTTTGSRTPLMAIHHKRYITDSGRDIAKYLNDRVNYIDHDAFELGIKVGDDWWFEGDIIKHVSQIGILSFGINEREVFVIADDDCTDSPPDTFYLGYSGWYVKWKDNSVSVFPETDFSQWERIGNIHEETADD